MMSAPKRKRAPGAGRKPLSDREPTGRHAVTMPDSYWEASRDLGDGNVSAGIRKALEAHINKSRTR